MSWSGLGALVLGTGLMIFWSLAYNYIWGRKKDFWRDFKDYYSWDFSDKQPDDFKDLRIQFKHWPFFLGIVVVPFVTIFVMMLFS
ncbi:MAG: hypothetical protein AAFO68_10025 [Pseudomonadota bacterium]